MKYLATGILLFVSAQFVLAQNSNDTFNAYRRQIPGTQLSFNMVPVKAGSFLMGSNATEKGRDTDEGPQHKMFVPAFWMGAFEVSRDEFDAFYKDENTSENSPVDAITRPSAQYIDFSLGMGKEGGYPVNSLSQYAALMYCRWLYNKTGEFYRLPTEAEWEYACKAGAATTYYFGNDENELEKYGWFKNNSNKKFQKSGQKLPNAFGLYDMLGNVSEWTLDHYDEKAFEKNTDTAAKLPAANPARYPKVLKGGSYMDDMSALRPANRIPSEPVWNRRDPQIPKSKWWLTDAPFVGFRIIRPLAAPTKEEAEAFFVQYLGR